MPAKLLGGSIKQPKIAQHLEELKESEKINRRGVLSQRKTEIVIPPEKLLKRDLSDPAKQDQDVALKQQKDSKKIVAKDPNESPNTEQSISSQSESNTLSRRNIGSEKSSQNNWKIIAEVKRTGLKSSTSSKKDEFELAITEAQPINFTDTDLKVSKR